MANALGSLHWVGFKPQGTAGSAEATVSHFLPGKGLQMAANRTLIPRLTAAATGGTLAGRAGWIAPTGSYKTCECHASFPYLWYWLLGAVTTTTPAGTVRLHSITEAADPIRLTCEGYPVYGSQKQTDAYLNKLTFNFKVGEWANFTDIEWLALGHDDAPTLTSTPTFTADPLMCTAVSIKLAGTQSYIVTGGSITIDRGLVGYPVLTNTLGGQPQLVRREGMAKITGAYDFLDVPTAEITKMVAATSFATIVEVQGATIESSYKQFQRVTLPDCQWTGGLDPEADEAMITTSGQFTANYDTTTSKQILVESQNTLTAINT
jgi:hypothetical protein